MNDAESVLVVEDDPQINMLVGAYVELAGLEYRTALTGASALQQAGRAPPALIVLDLMLPDMDGFEICRRIKNDPRTAHVPIIILTALDNESSRQEGLRCGASEYLTKPFDPEILLDRLSRLTPQAGS